MSKDAYYFPHDTNAQKDPKCSALINDFGFAGYGIYWAIIEILHQQEDGRLEKFPKLFDGLAYDLKIEKEALLRQFEALLNDYNLLKQDEKYIWSDRVLKNIESRKSKYLKKSEAGRIGGLMSGESRKTKQNEAMLEANEQKERKGKEIKEKDSSVFRHTFTPPTKEELEAYCKEVNIIIDRTRFIDFYASKGWMVGKNKMKDWKAAVRNWARGEKKTTDPYVSSLIRPEDQERLKFLNESARRKRDGY